MKNDAQKGYAPGVGGAQVDQAGEPTSTKKTVVDCSSQNITAVYEELMRNGIILRCASGASQLETLTHALQFRGNRGINSFEGAAIGWLRLSARILELKENWDIYTLKEDVTGPDGLLHKGVARYVLLGRRKDRPLPPPAQGSFPAMGASS